MPRPRMPSDVAALLRRHHGVITAAAAVEAGVDRSRLHRLAQAGTLARPARGTYVDHAELDGADPWRRHLLIARAVARTGAPNLHLTGWSAIAHFRLPTLGAPPRTPELIDIRGRTGSGRRSIERGIVPPPHRLVGTDGSRIVSPAFAAMDIARRSPVRSALVVADAVARHHFRVEPRLRHRFDLAEALEMMRGWPGRRRAKFVAEHADPAAETALESIGRFSFLAADLPPSVSNAWLLMPNGRWYRADHLWPHHGVVAEGNGAMKYDVLERASQRMHDERERERQLRQENLDIVHYTWDLAFHDPDELGRRLGATLDARPIRTDPVPWWKVDDRGERVRATPTDQPPATSSGIILPAGWDRPSRDVSRKRPRP